MGGHILRLCRALLKQWTMTPSVRPVSRRQARRVGWVLRQLKCLPSIGTRTTHGVGPRPLRNSAPMAVVGEQLARSNTLGVALESFERMKDEAATGADVGRVVCRGPPPARSASSGDLRTRASPPTRTEIRVTVSCIRAAPSRQSSRASPQTRSCAAHGYSADGS